MVQVSSSEFKLVCYFLFIFISSVCSFCIYGRASFYSMFGRLKMNLVLLETIRITFITLFNWPEDILETTLFCTQFSLLTLLAIQISAVFFSAFAVMSILYGFRSYDIAILGVIMYGMIEVWYLLFCVLMKFYKYLLHKSYLYHCANVWGR